MNHDKFFKPVWCKHVKIYGQLLAIPFMNKTSVGARLYGICLNFCGFLLVAGVHLIGIH